MKSFSQFLSTMIVCLHLFSGISLAAGKVYLVLGSDTAIWEGMNVAIYHCTYNLDLYTDPLRNAYKVMAPLFRAQFVDSYGQPLKMTWWMMAGNIFRYAVNRNIPIPNIMTMYLMKKYHGTSLIQLGDELSLHYHTFNWTDYDGDGIWYWNQARSFLECRDDFDYTLCQFMLEEQVFPVSFRSGWHFMDNDWQNYLDQLLPYSMHNDYPVHGVDVSEPLDNNYDWSQAPAEWVPFHPSPENYQRPGNCRGWNVRSAHWSRALSRDYLHEIFQQAATGVDQVACIWGHLPETDFIANIQKIDSVAHDLARRYPDVTFHYCTAIEAMQRWRKTNDAEAPLLTLEQQTNGDEVTFLITVNEPIFQSHPFVAAKDIYERYSVLPCEAVGQNHWRTAKPLSKNILAKVGVVVCDTVGNQAMDFIQYLPDDILVDNGDAGFVELNGNWITSSKQAWGVDARVAGLTATDTVCARWIPEITQSGYYNILIQVPAIENPANHIIFYLYANDQRIDTVIFNQPLPPLDWVYIGTALLPARANNYLELVATGRGQVGKVVAADVAKFSALVRERQLAIEQNFIDLGEVSQDDTISWNLKIENRGYRNLTIFDGASTHQLVSPGVEFPFKVAGMSAVTLPLYFYARNMGAVVDTLTIHSDDPVQSIFRVPITARVVSFFKVIDNEDSSHYREFGTWSRSNAQAYGRSSRYAWLMQIPRPWASFTTELNINGAYQIFEIVPKTVNASNNAVYVLSISDVVVDSIKIDQNEGSGSWVSLGRYYLPARHKIEIKVVDTGKNTNPNAVLRADAIKLALIDEISWITNFDDNCQFTYDLAQNYPNPFNTRTTIRYAIPQDTKVQLRILNVLGQEIAQLVDEMQTPGSYSVTWETQGIASGIYLYQLRTDNCNRVKKLIIIK